MSRLPVFLMTCGCLFLSVPRTHAEPPSAGAKYEPICRGKTAAEWVKALCDKDPDVRNDAAFRLHRADMDDPEDREVMIALVPVLGKLLQDEDDNVRSNAVGALGRAGWVSKAAVPLLIEAIKDKEVRVRVEAMTALGSVGPGAKDAVPVLMAALRDPGRASADDVRKAAMSALARIGPAARAAIPMMIEIAKEKGGEERWSMLLDVCAFGPDAKDVVPLLLEMLKDKDRRARSEALYLLTNLGPAAEPAIPAFIEALRGDDDDLCMMAMHGLRRLGPTAKAAIPALLEALDTKREIRQTLMGQDFVWSVPAEAAQVLADVGMKDKEVILRLARAVKRGAFRWQYWPSLLQEPKLGPVNEVTVATLSDVLKDTDPKARAWAAYTLGLVGPQASAAAPALVGRLKDDDEGARWAAATALGQIDSQTEQVVRGLAGALKDSAVGVRQAAAVVLGQCGSNAKPAAPALAEASKDQDAYVRIFAARALYAAGDTERAVPVLVAALRSENYSVRLSAVEGLDGLGSAAEAAAPALTRAVNDTFPLVRFQAAFALYKLRGAEAKAAVPVFVEIASNGATDSRRALDALKKIDPDAHAKVRRAR
jgi:HEAT repeat protein